VATLLKDFVSIENSANGLKLTIDTNGLGVTDTADAGKVQVIYLEGVTTANFGSTDAQAILQKMLTDGNLKYGE